MLEDVTVTGLSSLFLLCTLPSYPAGFPRDHRRLTAPRANVPEQSSARAGDDVDSRRAVSDKPRGRRRRRR